MLRPTSLGLSAGLFIYSQGNLLVGYALIEPDPASELPVDSALFSYRNSGERTRVDLELASKHYKTARIAQKVKAGFTVYMEANNRSSVLRLTRSGRSPLGFFLYDAPGPDRIADTIGLHAKGSLVSLFALHSDFLGRQYATFLGQSKRASGSLPGAERDRFTRPCGEPFFWQQR